MALEHNHECNNCGNNPKRDECYREECKEEYANDAYDRGQKEGYDEGYAAAEKELAKNE